MNAASMMASKSSERNWKLKATYVEIYNESLRDLLLPEQTPAHERGTILIREESKGHIFLTGLREVDINSVEDLLAALNFGSTIRQTDSTAINAQSSRSHAVFSLRLIQNKARASTGAEKRFSMPVEGMSGSDSVVKIDSKFHFVDLAGSERLKNTGAQGDRAREGISINAGLASLGKVISQLAKQGSHISYRDSKLTRLLSDSLGGSAITYMIACVTPAEFHLSETLNTLQYAQRTRAIQSKPKIQQTTDDSDKTALIERLKAEIAFLHKQIQNERAGERRTNGTSERPERSNDREVELQNQLLDGQENYNALSQRHAKLIAELARARDEEHADSLARENLQSDSATDHLKRSTSFAEAVEKVVLEYESTIQSLEQSLSQTRSSLSNIETDLLEKESKCAYTETINTQLQARLQKMLDRESSTEHYLHDLEAKLDGHNSGEEKNSAVITELKKEIARARESEANCEDYISTLEERLAEAEQDQEVMQREIDRLEHVVERQRSLGKLDNLLYELDHIQKDEKVLEKNGVLTNGTHSKSDHSRHQSTASRLTQQDVIHESENEDEITSDINHRRTESEGPIDNGESIEEAKSGSQNLNVERSALVSQSPAQSKFVEDKLENVTQELFDLKVEHESTLSEFDLLNAKYEEALRTLAELQDSVDEARHSSRNPRDSIMSVDSTATTRPLSFLADARVSGRKGDGQLSSSRSLSSELSSHGDLNDDSSESEVIVRNSASDSGARATSNEEQLLSELENLKKLAQDRDEAQYELAKQYAELEGRHMAALDQVEDLKTEVSKVRLENSTPRASTPVIRRKSSQNVMMVDKAHRAFASLRSIADERLQGDEDVLQNFDLHWTTAMHELHTRSERVQELEAEIAKSKQDMDEKMRMINGLTRERTSMKANPLDMSVVLTLKDQLEDNEKTLRSLRESHDLREKELLSEIEALQTSVRSVPFASSSKDEVTAHDIDESATAQIQKIADLESVVASTEDQHRQVIEKMQQAHDQLEATITDLEQQLASHKTEQASSTARDTEEHGNSLQSLRQEIDDHKSALSVNAMRVAELERNHTSTRQQLDEAVKSRDLIHLEAENHKSMISRLEQQISEHAIVVQSHQDGMELLKQNHAKALEEIAAATKTRRETELVFITSQHGEKISKLQAELVEARSGLSTISAQVASALGLSAQDVTPHAAIARLTASHKALDSERSRSGDLERRLADLSTINDKTSKDLASLNTEVANLRSQLEESNNLKTQHASLTQQLAVLTKEKDELDLKNKKNSRLVEELEDQLATNFDQHQIATNRLSTLQTERNVQLEEANSASIRAQGELQAIKEEFASLQVRRSPEGQLITIHTNILQAKLDEAQAAIPQRANSLTSGGGGGTLRKSASVATLPSPPPAIPLPPLPGNLNAALANSAPNNNMAVPLSPTSNRPGSHEVKYANFEDQEARIRTIEKHLMAEKQLTNTLEEALTDLERQSNKVKADCDAWRRRAGEVEAELKTMQAKVKTESEKENRLSMLQVEEERKKRQAAEVARQNLEERMNAISKKKKKGSLNCF